MLPVAAYLLAPSHAVWPLLECPFILPLGCPRWWCYDDHTVDTQKGVNFILSYLSFSNPAHNLLTISHSVLSEPLRFLNLVQVSILYFETPNTSSVHISSWMIRSIHVRLSDCEITPRTSYPDPCKRYISWIFLTFTFRRFIPMPFFHFYSSSSIKLVESGFLKEGKCCPGRLCPGVQLMINWETGEIFLGCVKYDCRSIAC